MGLVSYYIGATPDKFARKTLHYKNLVMDTYHQEIYDIFEAVEEENQNDVSMVSWFDDAYGTLYRKHKMGSSRQPVTESAEAEIQDVIDM